MDCSLDDYVKQNKIGKRGGAAGKAFYNKGQGKKVIIRAWTAQNKKGTFDFSQNFIKSPSGDFKQVSEEF